MGRAGEHGFRGFIRVYRIRLPAHPANLTIGSDDFDDEDPGCLQMHRDTRAIRVCSLNSDLPDDAERGDICRNRLVADQRGWEPGIAEPAPVDADHCRSAEHTSELQSLMRISYAVFCLKQKQYTHK